MKNKKNLLIVTTIVLFFVMFITIGNKKSDKNIDNNYHYIPRDFLFHKELLSGDIETSLSIEILDEGEDIYIPKNNGYRYGPSIIYYDDGSMDAWFASNGNNSEWDWITYRHFDNNEWSDEEVVLRPTKKSKDHYSTCDPGVIYFDGYYYIGYTSTENSSMGGIENNIFVARSKNPNGPYEKWDGKSWGKNPSPIITYENKDGAWGAGEISFVILDDELYCYYSWIDLDGSYIKLAKASLSDDWPNTIKEIDTVIRRYSGQGSFDVAYNDDYNKFLAFSVENSFNAQSSICVFESDDGINFRKVNDNLENIKMFAHNMGISKKLDGHIGINDELVLGYAYSKSSIMVWGRWAACMHKAKLKIIPRIN